MHYTYPYRHYSQVFGIPERSIKRWVALGKGSNPPDLPPFDSPAGLPAWWSRHSNQRMPTRLTAFLAGEKPKPVEIDANDAKLNENFNDEPLDRAKKHLAVADKRLVTALAADPADEGLIAHATRIWQNTFEIFLKAKNAAEEDERRRGQWAPINDVAADVANILEYLRHMRATLARRVIAHISVILDPAAQEELTAAIIKEQANEESLLRRLGSIARPEHDEQVLTLTA